MTESDADLTEEFDLEELPDSVDRAAVRRMKTVAWALDESITIPGTNYKIGLDPIISVVPVGGDVVSATISLYIVAESARLGVTYDTLLMMLANVAVDTGVGAIPYVGDIADAGWKANKRNVELALTNLTESEPEEEPVEIPVEQ
ncbi:DUF4112 domain-containing protein [Halobacterium zhouii]|uniref:DUF4112 domain-containing protein n=1 Tax=Halobacterium zhouii TaxID=2902624 RepID=UPI001E44F9BA|nr:DUF4112 domain-containing protein [Halobacterium zhouii]